MVKYRLDIYSGIIKLLEYGRSGNGAIIISDIINLEFLLKLQTAEYVQLDDFNSRTGLR